MTINDVLCGSIYLVAQNMTRHDDSIYLVIGNMTYDEGILNAKNNSLSNIKNSKRSTLDRIIDLKEWLKNSLTDNIWILMIIWLLDLLSAIITVHYQLSKTLFPPYFVWYSWRHDFRPCTWSAKVWHVYDRAGTWSSRGQNSRTSYGVSP